MDQPGGEREQPAGRSVWRFGMASRAHVVIDGAATLMVNRKTR